MSFTNTCFLLFNCREILSTAGRKPLSDKGPSDKWFRDFFARHPLLSEKKAVSLLLN